MSAPVVTQADVAASKPIEIKIMLGRLEQKELRQAFARHRTAAEAASAAEAVRLSSDLFDALQSLSRAEATVAELVEALEGLIEWVKSDDMPSDAPERLRIAFAAIDSAKDTEQVQP